MPNSTVYEKRNVLPGGGGSFPFIKPPTEAPTLQTPQMQPQLQTQPSPLGLKPVSQQMTERVTPTLSRNYFSKPQVTTAPTPTPTAKPTPTYTPSASNPTQSVLDYMLAPSKEEQKLYRDNESKKRLLVLADALRHIGNIYNTTRGATPQQFNSPVVQQEQLYQQKKNELRTQRAAALKNAMDQAKLNADLSYKNSMLGMRQAELERGLANDRFNQQLNLGKFAYNQEKDKNDWALRLAAQQEAARHNRTSEGLRRQGNSLTAASLSLRQQQQQTKDLKDMQPIKIAQGGTGYISKRWINSPEGRAEIKAMYNKMRSMKQRMKDGSYKPLINEAKIKKDEYGRPVAAEPSTMDMLVAMQEGAWSMPYMEWIGRYGIDPTGNNWTSKSPTYYKKVAKGHRSPASPQQQAKPKSLSDKYSKYER